MEKLSNRQKEKAKFPLFPKVINGAIAGIVGVVCLYPPDLVKTRLQNQQPSTQGEIMYRSLYDCFKKTYEGEGLLGMYRGISVNMLFVTFERAIKLSANDFFRYHLVTSEGTLPMVRQIVAGGLAGLCQTVVTTPMELLKIQLQDAGRVAVQDRRMKSNMLQKITATEVGIGIIKERGILGLYTGLMATVLREVIFSAICFPLFHTLNSLGPRKAEGSKESVFWVALIAGTISGAFSAFIVTPIDVVKTRLQAVIKCRVDQTYTGMTNAFRRIVKHEGVHALFRGGACRVIILGPQFGITQMVYYVGIGELLASNFKSY